MHLYMHTRIVLFKILNGRIVIEYQSPFILTYVQTYVYINYVYIVHTYVICIHIYMHIYIHT